MEYNFDDKRQALANKFEQGLSSGDLQYFDTHEFIEIIDFFLESNDTLKAEKAIKNGLIQHPYSTDITVRKADWLFETDRFEEAEQEVDSVLEIDASNSEANELKGDLLINRGDPIEGIILLQKAIENSEEKLELYTKIGIELLQIGQVDKALQFFYYVLDQDMNDETVLFNITYCFDVLSKPNVVIDFLNKYIDVNPYSQIAWHQLGLQYKELEDYEKAIWAFDYAIVVDETFLGAFFEKASCLEKVEKHAEAIELYKQSLTMADPTAWTYYRMGHAYDGLNDTDQAVSYFYKAIHEDPMMGSAWFSLARIYTLNSMTEKALEYAEKSVEIDFDNKEYNSLLARLYLKLARYEETENIYENLIALEVEDAEIWIEYSILLRTSGFEDDATELLLKSLSYFPNNAEILYRLSGSLFSVSREMEAIEYLQEALKANFNMKDILKIDFPIVYHSELVQDLIFSHKFQQKFL